MKNLFTQRNLIIALAAILGFFGFLVAFDYGLKTYNQWKGEQGVENLKKALEKIEEDAYQKMMADTYGGKTPEETLNMYIDAVEKGDYELASKYLIEENQEKELKGLLNIKSDQKFFQEYLSDIKKAESDGEVSGDTFRMKSKIKEGPYYFIRFIKYPNGIWKIKEI